MRVIDVPVQRRREPARRGWRARHGGSSGRAFAIAVLAASALAPAFAEPSPAAARGSVAFAFSMAAAEQENCVEQQSDGLGNCGSPTAVVNPTGCIWTVDQYTIDKAGGELAPGSTASDHMCLISDGLAGWWGEPHWVSAGVTSSKDNLAVSLKDQFGDVWPIQPTSAGNGYAWSLCMAGPSYAVYPIIPGSNGGFGVQTDYTLSVTNTTAQMARGVAAQFEIQGTSGPC